MDACTRPSSQPEFYSAVPFFGINKQLISVCSSLRSEIFFVYSSGVSCQTSICSYDSMAGNDNGNFIMSNRTAYCLGGHMGSVFHLCHSARNFSICDRLSVGDLQ